MGVGRGRDGAGFQVHRAAHEVRRHRLSRAAMLRGQSTPLLAAPERLGTLLSSAPAVVKDDSLRPPMTTGTAVPKSILARQIDRSNRHRHLFQYFHVLYCHHHHQSRSKCAETKLSHRPGPRFPSCRFYVTHAFPITRCPI